jgi:hypothetical protein
MKFSPKFFLYYDDENNKWDYEIKIDHPEYRMYLFLDPFRNNREYMDMICGRFMKNVRR